MLQSDPGLSGIALYHHIRELIFTHTALINPSPHGKLELITCPWPNYRGWDIQVVVLTQEPYERRILAQDGNSSSEIMAMQALLFELQVDNSKILHGRRMGELFNIEERTSEVFENECGDRRRSMGHVQRSPSPPLPGHRGRRNGCTPMVPMGMTSNRSLSDDGDDARRYHNGIPLTDRHRHFQDGNESARRMHSLLNGPAIHSFGHGRSL
jgi:hypothetical protein